MRDEFREALSDDLEDWLRARPFSWNSGNLWVVHAAAKPLVPMQEQDPHTLLWGHGEFMTSPRPDGIWVAHGHVVVEQPEMRASRIAMDTGAYYSGRLTGAMIRPDGDVSFVQAVA